MRVSLFLLQPPTCSFSTISDPTVQIEELMSQNAGSLTSQLEVGTLVRARYKKQRKFFRGKIAQVHANGTYEIHYDDGDEEKALPREYIEVRSGYKIDSRVLVV